VPFAFEGRQHETSTKNRQSVLLETVALSCDQELAMQWVMGMLGTGSWWTRVPVQAFDAEQKSTP
jgi:hypothetical protein